VNVYERYVLPQLINLSMQNKAATAERATFGPLASGIVVEVGFGSGLNLPFYSPKVGKLYALDPSRELLRMARRRVASAKFPVEILQASAEEIPLENMVADTVVTTWTLCTIPDPVRALREMRRILKPSGQFIFVEHGRSPEPKVLAWQDRLNRVWNRLGGGCNLNRPIDALIPEAGFRIVRIEQGYGKGPKLLVYLYKGLAQR
jgi:ubiquinone/menaquinone biosynthesis C-methylase UbiE